MPSTPSIDKRSLKHAKHGHRHEAHSYLHAHHGQVKENDKRVIEKRSVGQLISATIDGQVVSWTNEYAGPGVSTSLPSPMAISPDEATASASEISTRETSPEEVVTSLSTILQTMTVFPEVSTPTPTPSQTSSNSTEAVPQPASSGAWTRQAYYDAASGTAQGLTFLNHYGGTDGIPGTASGGPA